MLWNLTNIGVLASISSSVTNTLLNNILSYWKLDNNGSGGVSLVDSTGNGVTLTNNGGVALGDGEINNGAVFPTPKGSSQWLRASNSSIAVGTGDFTISAWIKPASFSDQDFITAFCLGLGGGSAFGDRLTLCVNPDGQLFNIWGPNAALHNSYATLNVWNHVTLVRKDNVVSLYLNGVSSGTPFTPTAYNNYDENLIFGLANDQLGTSNYIMEGGIDEVGLWNRALTLSEIASLYNSGNGLSYPFTSLVENILAYWKLDNNGSGGVSLIDSTGNGNTLTNSGEAPLGVGKINNGAVFTGTTNYLSTPTGFAPLTNQRTYSGWVRFNNTSTGYQMVFMQGGTSDYQSVNPFYIENNGTVSSIFTTSNGSWTNLLFTSIVPSANTWHHFATTFDGSVAKLYWNGTEVASSVYSGSIPDPDNNFFTLGSYPAFGSFGALNGNVDEVGVWTKALTPSEISSIYNSGNGRTYPFI